MLKETVTSMLTDTNLAATTTLNIADLGCSSGPNTLLVISQIVNTIHQIHLSTQVQVFLNDLPGNDSTAFSSPSIPSMKPILDPFLYRAHPGPFTEDYSLIRACISYILPLVLIGSLRFQSWENVIRRVFTCPS